MKDLDKHNEILDKIGRNDGMTVPEGFFDEFKRQMADSLPQRPELQPDAAIRRTTWQRIRPYVYMAAMFAGIWCMLKMFTMLAPETSTPLESNPVIAEALNDDDFVNTYLVGDINQWDLYDELMEDGIDPDSLCDSISCLDFSE